MAQQFVDRLRACLLVQVLEQIEGESVVAAREQLEAGRRQPPAGGRAPEATPRRHNGVGQALGGEGVEMTPYTHAGELQLTSQLGDRDPGLLAQQQQQIAPGSHQGVRYRESS